MLMSYKVLILNKIQILELTLAKEKQCNETRDRLLVHALLSCRILGFHSGDFEECRFLLSCLLLCSSEKQTHFSNSQ
jgi:hypothetical protein